MALADTLKRINNTLKDSFSQKPYDPAPGRRRVAKLIDKAKSQFLEGRSKVPNRAWTLGYEAVSFKLELNGETIPIGGEPTNYLAQADFVPFLEELRADVEAGELDAEIRSALEAKAGGPSVAVVAPADKPARRGGISAEAAKARGAKAAASRKANREARLAGPAAS